MADVTTVPVQQESIGQTEDGRPIFGGEYVAAIHAEQGRLVIVIYGAGVVMSVPLNLDGAKNLKKALDEFLANPVLRLPGVH